MMTSHFKPLAVMPAQRTAAAARQRRCRRRRRLGLLLAGAEVPMRLAERLVEAGLLSEDEAADPERLGAALTISVQVCFAPAVIAAVQSGRKSSI